MDIDTPVARNIKLVATDLDGTLIGSANEFPLYSVFRDEINALRRRNNAVWAACTGRTLRSYSEFFAPMRTMGLMPDYVVVRHAYIYGLTRFGYLPHVFWNLHIRHQIWANQIYVKHAIEEWHDMITGGALGVRTIRRRRNRLCLRFDTEEAASVAADMLREKVAPYKHLRVFKYFQEVDVRAVPFTKGLAVQELASHLGLRPEHILTIGNGHNDISMLGRHVAHYQGCPSNSEPEVIEVVHSAGGHIASKRSLSGVMEILSCVLEGRVNSDLPEGWVPPSQSPNPDSTRHQRHHTGYPRRHTGWIVLGMIYAVLVVLASFEVIPFAGIITLPFTILASAFEKVLSFLYR